MAHKAIKAEFHGPYYCVADGHIAYGHAPGLQMCRVLLEEGYDPRRPLHIYRGEDLAFRVKSIGWGAMFVTGGESAFQTNRGAFANP